MRSFRLRLVPAVIVSILLIPAAVRAQTPVAEPEAAAAKAFDATVYVAWFRANRGGIGGETFRDWYSTGLLGAGFGHYWTEHLKTDAEFTGTGRGRLVSFEDLDGPQRFSRGIYRDHSYRIHTLSIVQSYQFRHNAWVHPFVGAGIDLDWEHRTTDGSVQTFDSGSDQPFLTIEPLPREDRTRLIPRAAVVAGFKAYIARHAYLRTDVRASITDRIDQVTWRFGVGCDF